MKKKFKRKKIPLFYATFQCGRYSILKELLILFDSKKVKNGSQKLLIIGPTPFFHSPAQTTAQSQESRAHI